MGKTFRYVKEFDFSTAGKPVGCEMMSHGGAVMRKAAGGGVVTKAAAPKMKNNTVAKLGRQEAAVMKSRMIPEGSGMVSKPETLGVKGNKNPGMRRGVPVAPKQPMISAYKAGGAVPKAGAYKIPKVMSEYKAGELHSGSKTGPVVKSRKQAVAIALSEARAAGKKK